MNVPVLTEADIVLVKEAATLIQQSLNSHLTIPQWAVKLQFPEKKLKSAFKEVHGVGLFTYLRQARIEKAKTMLLDDEPIKAIILAIGYNHEGNFSKAFRKVAGESPRSWKEKEYV
jgi:AraC-like DNA-binding protein